MWTSRVISTKYVGQSLVRGYKIDLKKVGFCILRIFRAHSMNVNSVKTTFKLDWGNESTFIQRSVIKLSQRGEQRDSQFIAFTCPNIDIFQPSTNLKEQNVYQNHACSFSENNKNIESYLKHSTNEPEPLGVLFRADDSSDTEAAMFNISLCRESVH